MTQELQGKKILVFAGVTGTGRATAEVAAREGADVVTLSRALPTDQRAVDTMKSLHALGNGKYRHITCDVTDRDSVFRCVQEAADFLGGIDGLSLGQGTDHIMPSNQLTREAMQADLNTAYFGSMYACQAAFPYLKERGGSILLYGAAAMSEGNLHYAAYSASKGAIVGAGRTLAREWAPYNIRVNVVAPVLFTEISEEYIKVAAPEDVERSARLLDKIPMGEPGKTGWDRMGKAAEAGELNSFLLSDRSRFITGQYINVDGGMVLGRF